MLHLQNISWLHLRYLRFLLAVILQTILLAPATAQHWTQLAAGMNVHAILPAQNEIWIGTDDGLIKLNRADNSKVVYNTANSLLKSNIIYALTKDAQGVLWIGTRNGLAKYDGATWVTFDVGLKTHSVFNSVLDIEITDAGKIWLSMNSGGGLVEAIENADQWPIHTPSGPGISLSDLVDIEIDGSGNIWGVWRPGGIVKFNGNWTLYESITDSDNGHTTILDLSVSIALDSQDKLWVATEHEGLVSFDGTSWRIHDTDLGLSYDVIGYMKDIQIDGQDNKWVSTDKKGLFKVTPANAITFYETPPELLDALTTIVFDDQTTWIGTTKASVVKFDGAVYTSIRTSSVGMLSDAIGKIMRGVNGTMWIATGNGLMKYSDPEWSVFTTDNSILNMNSMGSIVHDSHDNIWVATIHSLFASGPASALYTIDPQGSWHPVDLPAPINYITDMTIYNDVLWIIGSDMGSLQEGKVAKLENDQWAVYSGTSLTQDAFRCIAVDGTYCWVGTASKGVARLDIAQQRWDSYTTADGLSGNTINQIVLQDNTVWVGVESIYDGQIGAFVGGGLSKWDGSHWSVVQTYSELIGNTVTALWVSGAQILAGTAFRGFLFFNGSEWHTINTNNARITSNNITSVAQDADGAFYIGTDRGLTTTVDLHTGGGGVTGIGSKHESVIKVYPNPTASRLFISGLDQAGTIRYIIYNAQGVKLFEGDVVSDEIELSEWKGQLLTIQFRLHAGNVTKKILVK